MANGDPLYGPREWRRDDGTTVVAGRAAEPVPPVTDNERDAALIRKVLTVHSGADFLADDFPTLEEGQDAWRALTRLVAALSAATTERDEWKHDYYRDVAAHYDTKIAAERRAKALAAQLQQAREALRAVQAGFEAFFDRERQDNSGLHELLNTESVVRAALAAGGREPTLTEPEDPSRESPGATAGDLSPSRGRSPSGSVSAGGREPGQATAGGDE